MPVEFRIISGARTGQVQRFEQAVIVVGRHASADLRFDPQKDLDVSGRHAELRGTEGRYSIHDHGSTNGTYVNGTKVDGSAELADGDKITFGAKGPQTEVRIWAEGAEPPAAMGAGRSTEQRIAIAVSKQTAGLRRYFMGGVLLVLVAVGAAFYFGRRASAQRVEELNKLIAANDSLRVGLQGSMRASGDTTFSNELQRKLTELQQRLPAAKSDAERDSMKTAIEDYQGQLRAMIRMDLPMIHRRNAPAVAILIADIEGKNSAGTGFSITSDGLIVTNRHNVKDPATGALARRIAVKFTNTSDWLPASIVKVSDKPDEDIALIKMDREGPYPAIEGISSGAEASEGVSVVTIGYPLGYDTPMEGDRKEFIAKSTLNPGTVSKKTSSVLQIDSFAAHGSSGSPVFSARGLVVGIVWGGPPDVGGKIVYAVPSERLAGFIPDSLRAVIRD